MQPLTVTATNEPKRAFIEKNFGNQRRQWV